MASIESVTLTIMPVPNSAMVSVNVGYRVRGSSHDIAAEQNYRELCQLIGDDTPGDKTDDILYNLLDQTTAFSGTGPNSLQRAIQHFVPVSILDEDSGGPFLEEDEIRARVTLIPIPTSRESNLVRRGGVVPPDPSSG